MSTVQLTHVSQLLVKSHGDGWPDELLETDEEDDDPVEFVEDKPEPP